MHEKICRCSDCKYNKKIMRFVFILIFFIGGCSKTFKTNYESKNEIVIEELEPMTELEKVKAEMQERLAELKNE